VEITMRAEVSDTNMTVEDVLALKPGDTIRLDGHAASGITLYADQVPVHRARPGRSGLKRAAQVLGPAEEGR
jgi:flagellar motor switch protein FliM